MSAANSSLSSLPSKRELPEQLLALENSDLFYVNRIV